MVPRQIRDALEREKVSYQVITHDKAYTAQGVAAAMHMTGWGFAKAVILKTRDGRLVMAVIPGPAHVDLKAVGRMVGVPVELANEAEFARLFPECELGAEPPFGSLYDLNVYADEGLRMDAEIVFNAGRHTEAIRMKYADYERLARPTVGRIASA